MTETPKPKDKQYVLMCTTHGVATYNDLDGNKVPAISTHMSTLEYAKTRHLHDFGGQCKFEIKEVSANG